MGQTNANSIEISGLSFDFTFTFGLELDKKANSGACYGPLNKDHSFFVKPNFLLDTLTWSDQKSIHIY